MDERGLVSWQSFACSCDSHVGRTTILDSRLRLVSVCEVDLFYHATMFKTSIIAAQEIEKVHFLTLGGLGY